MNLLSSKLEKLQEIDYLIAFCTEMQHAMIETKTSETDIYKYDQKMQAYSNLKSELYSCKNELIWPLMSEHIKSLSKKLPL